MRSGRFPVSPLPINKGLKPIPHTVYKQKQHTQRQLQCSYGRVGGGALFTPCSSCHIKMQIYRLKKKRIRYYIGVELQVDQNKVIGQKKKILGFIIFQSNFKHHPPPLMQNPAYATRTAVSISINYMVIPFPSSGQYIMSIFNIHIVLLCYTSRYLSIRNWPDIRPYFRVCGIFFFYLISLIFHALLRNFCAEKIKGKSQLLKRHFQVCIIKNTAEILALEHQILQFQKILTILIILQNLY